MHKQTGWYIETETYLDETEYSIVREAQVPGMPKLCLGVFRGIEQLRAFGEMLRKALADGRAAEQAREEYEQIISAIEEEMG